MSLSALPTARFDVIAPAGFALLGALDNASEPDDLVITCGSEGHPPDDPHTLGKAYDVRSHTFTDEQKQGILLTVMNYLGTPIRDISGGYITEKFFGWLESPGTPNEHFHFQLRHGASYP